MRAAPTIPHCPKLQQIDNIPPAPRFPRPALKSFPCNQFVKFFCASAQRLPPDLSWLPIAFPVDAEKHKMCNRSAVMRLLGGTILLAVGLCGQMPADDGAQLKVPPGFVVTQYADDRLAHDVFSLTFDPFGRVVVSGPGYVRILIDSNNDGVADSYKQFADGPASGAQGLCFRGRDLICTGDAG